MSRTASPRVTFDTNVCNVIHDPHRWPDKVDPEDARKVREAIPDGRILGFVSEATLFIECLSFEDKLSYLAVADANGSRPSLDPRAVARMDDVAKLGAKLLHAPLIGAEIFFDGFEWAGDDIFTGAERQQRFFDFCRPLGDLEKLTRSGEELDEKYPKTFGDTPMKGPATWRSAFRRAWDADPDGRKRLRGAVGPMIGEWCDGLIVGSHFACGNDVFCTIDHGKTAGPSSLLHPDNRAALRAKGITLMPPAELVSRYGL